MSDAERFFEAVRDGDREQVEAHLDRDPDLIESRDAEGRSPLLLAVYSGNHELVNLLSERRPVADVFEAAASGDAARVLELVREEPRRVHYTSPDGLSPLGLASFFGHAEVVELLLRAGADPDQRSRNAMGVTPLHSGAAHPDPETAVRICRELLAAGADPDVDRRGGWTALHEAASRGNLPLVRLLLRWEADPGAESDDGRTPVDTAREEGEVEVVAALERAAGEESEGGP